MKLRMKKLETLLKRQQSDQSAEQSIGSVTNVTITISLSTFKFCTETYTLLYAMKITSIT